MLFKGACEMARKQTGVNPICGERLRSLLEEHGMEQQELASRIGYTKEHISYIVNGKRNLTKEAAEAIVRVFPETRIGWLLGYEDHETDAGIIIEAANEFAITGHAIIKLMQFAAKLLGYQLKWSDSDCEKSGEGDIKEYDPNEVIFDLIKGHTKFEITAEEDKNFRDELTRYAVFLLEGLIHKKNDTWHPFAITKETLDNG